MSPSCCRQLQGKQTCLFACANQESQTSPPPPIFTPSDTNKSMDSIYQTGSIYLIVGFFIFILTNFILNAHTRYSESETDFFITSQ